MAALLKSLSDGCSATFCYPRLTVRGEEAGVSNVELIRCLVCCQYSSVMLSFVLYRMPPCRAKCIWPSMTYADAALEGERTVKVLPSIFVGLSGLRVYCVPLTEMV